MKRMIPLLIILTLVFTGCVRRKRIYESEGQKWTSTEESEIDLEFTYYGKTYIAFGKLLHEGKEYHVVIVVGDYLRIDFIENDVVPNFKILSTYKFRIKKDGEFEVIVKEDNQFNTYKDKKLIMKSTPVDSKDIKLENYVAYLWKATKHSMKIFVSPNYYTPRGYLKVDDKIYKFQIKTNDKKEFEAINLDGENKDILFKGRYEIEDYHFKLYIEESTINDLEDIIEFKAETYDSEDFTEYDEIFGTEDGLEERK